MTPAKRFFVALVIFLSTALSGIAYVLISRLHPIASTTFLFFGLVALAAVGRTSGAIFHACAGLLGRAVSFPPIATAVGLLSRRNIGPPQVKRTAKGRVEVPYEELPYSTVVSKLREKNQVERLPFDDQAFRDYLRSARYQDYYPDYYKGSEHYLLHKQVQHFLSTQITPIKGFEIWMDVASSSSPFPDILTRLYGIKVYRQDLVYPHGARGLYIGSDAACIPIPDACIDRASLHCSFEHFEGDSDIGFLNELARVLRPGGTACIIPLYLSDTYQILSNPRYWLSRGIPSADGAQITASNAYWESFGRFYDWPALQERVLTPLLINGMDYRLFQVELPSSLDCPSFMVLEIQKS